MLDPRTWRGFEGGPAEPPIQISDDGMKRQLTPSAALPSELTLILAPTNIMAVPLFHAGEKWYIQFIWRIATHIGSFKRSDGFARFYDPDLADSWEGQNDAHEKLLARLAARSKNLDNSRRQSHVIVLTGDVHFGWVGRLQYATQHPYRTPSTPMTPLPPRRPRSVRPTW